MAMAEPRRSAMREPSKLDGVRMLVVEARFYEDIADALLAGATRALQQAGAEFDRVSVPGSRPTAHAMHSTSSKSAAVASSAVNARASGS